jgi:lipopolysaccharide/colanic/teichoic acid biosynthesis glycosyltransferase
MRKVALLIADVLVILLATTAALILRDNFTVSEARLASLCPYLVLTAATSVVVLPLFGINHTFWRFTSLADYVKIALASFVIAAVAVAMGFGLNRMEGVPRALPVLQALLMVTGLVGMRVLARLHHAQRWRPTQLVAEAAEPGETVLVVGLNRMAELYLRTLAEFGDGRVRVAGILGRHARHLGRFVLRHPVLGLPEDVEQVLASLEVHGVSVDRILLTMPLDKLSAEAREALLRVERTTAIRVEELADVMRLRNPGGQTSPGEARNATGAAFVLDEDQLAEIARRPHWRVKRAIDIVLAAMLLIVLSPLVVLTAVVVAVDVGLPVGFWQQRPGLGGHPFRLYKLRTMAAAHDSAGRRIPDEKRTSAMGRFMRKSRLDELPQLISILVGDMSFVGPRPLLPIDQLPQYAARLLVRPGLTGWAQVAGGREISADDKAALDVWYVKNAGFLLDIKIMLATFPMIVIGERANPIAIRQAWSDLCEAGICRIPHSSQALQEPCQADETWAAA